MHRLTWLLPVALLGCDMGANQLTTVTSLQVLAATSDPQDVAQLEAHTLTLTIADPDGEGGRVRAFRCDPDLGCQSEIADVAESVEMPWTEVIPVAVPMWIMACAPGVCDLDNAAEDDLVDPTSWAQRLPREGVSLALRTPRLTDLPVDERPVGPVVTPIEATEENGLFFEVEGATSAVGWATQGGFSATSYEVIDGRAELFYFADDNAEGATTRWVIFYDDDGRQTVWSDTLAAP